MGYIRLKAWAKHAFSILVIAGLVIYVWQHWGDVEAGLDIYPSQLGLLVVLILITWVLNSLPMLIFLRLMKKRVGFWENFFVLVASTLGNYLPMRVGTVIRMRFFKKAHDLDYAAYIGIMAVRTFVLFMLVGALGCVGLAGMATTGRELPASMLAVFGGLVVFPALILLVPAGRAEEGGSRWKRLLWQLAAGHKALRANRGAFVLLLLIMLAQFAVLAVRLFVSFQAFGLEVEPWALLLLGPAATLVTFVNITPGNLGIREWIIGGLAELTGMNFQNGVFAGTLDRTVLMILTFLIGPACLYFTLKRTERSEKADSVSSTSVVAGNRN